MGPAPTAPLAIPAASSLVRHPPLPEGHPRIETGPYSYYDDPGGLERAT